MLPYSSMSNRKLSGLRVFSAPYHTFPANSLSRAGAQTFSVTENP